MSYYTGMTKKLHERNNRIAFPIQLFDGEYEVMPEVKISDEIHVVPTGEWEHWTGETFEITSDTVAAMVANFKDGARKDIPITAGHDFGNESPAIGWFKELIDRGVNGVYALVEWTEEGKRLMRQKAYKYFSAELVFDFKDLETGIKYDVLLTGGALTNKPFFKQLQLDPATFSEEQKNGPLSFSVPVILNQFNEQSNMDLNTILAKAKADRTAEEAQFILDNVATLTDEQKVAEGLGEGAGAGAGDEAGAGDDAGAEGAENGEGAGADAGAEAGEKPVEIAAQDGKPAVQITLAEYNALKGAADERDVLALQVKTTKLGDRFAGMAFSNSNPDGKFLPKQKDSVVAFMAGLSDKALDQFVNIVNTMPKLQIELGERGENNTAATNVKVVLDAKVKEVMAAKSLKYSQALKVVFSENPQLEKDYAASLEEAAE